MPQENNILKILNIQDKNIKLEENYYEKEIVKGELRHLVKAKLSYRPEKCPHCGKIYDHKIIKHGFKKTKIMLPKQSRINTYLILKKQRYLCKHCNRTFTLSSSEVEKHCFIGKKVKASVAIDLTEKSSIKDIAKRNNVSSSTVYRVMTSYYKSIKRKLNYLPKHLCFDEFKSVKSAKGAMSFIYCNADSGKIINIVENRRLYVLKQHFYRYSRQARNSVKKVVIDMYSPYISLIKEVFPKAKIVIDRFHIVQLISRAFNKTRIKAMNSNPNIRNKLKRYWKLLLKPKEELNSTYFRKYICFKKFMSQRTIVEYLISQSDELYASYNLYQNLLYAIKTKNIKMFKGYLTNLNKNISCYLKTSINTYIKYISHIENTFATTLSNGFLEGLIGKIKVIKRIAFGFRSFHWFKTRILITQNMLAPNY